MSGRKRKKGREGGSRGGRGRKGRNGEVKAGRERGWLSEVLKATTYQNLVLRVWLQISFNPEKKQTR